MRLEILIQFIVPLTFLAIWALTSLLNRDAQPLPPRPGRPGGGPGGAPPLARGPGQAEARPPAAPLQPRPSAASPAPPPSQAASAWPGPGAPPSSRDRLRPRQTQNLDEAIVYIENGPGPRGGTRTGASSPSSSRASRTAPARRSFRGRAAASPPPAPQGRSEPETPRALSDMMSQSRALQKAKPLELTPLSAPIVGLTRTLSDYTAEPDVNRRHAGDSRPTLNGVEVRNLLATPGRIREVILLNEILQPPLALRRGRRES